MHTQRHTHTHPSPCRHLHPSPRHHRVKDLRQKSWGQNPLFKSTPRLCGALPTWPLRRGSWCVPPPPAAALGQVGVGPGWPVSILWVSHPSLRSWGPCCFPSIAWAAAPPSCSGAGGLSLQRAPHPCHDICPSPSPAPPRARLSLGTCPSPALPPARDRSLCPCTGSQRLPEEAWVTQFLCPALAVATQVTLFTGHPHMASADVHSRPAADQLCPPALRACPPPRPPPSLLGGQPGGGASWASSTGFEGPEATGPLLARLPQLQPCLPKAWPLPRVSRLCPGLPTRRPGLFVLGVHPTSWWGARPLPGRPRCRGRQRRPLPGLG